jgi:hypothetical protein
LNTKYTIRENRTFANYRAKAIVFLNSYRVFEKEYCGSLFDEVAKLAKSKVLDSYREKGEALSEMDLMTPDFLDLVMKQNELTELQNEAKEMFLIENDYKNAKTLCEIYYEDCVFSADDFEDYYEMYEFLQDTIEGFFLKHCNMSKSGNSGKKTLPTELTQEK